MISSDPTAPQRCDPAPPYAMPLPAPGRRDLNFLAPAEVDLVTVRRLESLAQTLGEIGAYALNAVEMYVKYQAKSIEGIGVASHCRKVR